MKNGARISQIWWSFLSFELFMYISHVFHPPEPAGVFLCIPTNWGAFSVLRSGLSYWYQNLLYWKMVKVRDCPWKRQGQFGERQKSGLNCDRYSCCWVVSLFLSREILYSPSDSISFHHWPFSLFQCWQGSHHWLEALTFSCRRRSSSSQWMRVQHWL